MKAFGFLLCIFIAWATFLLYILYPALDPLTISIIAGILLGNILAKNNLFDSGVAFALKIFLPAGVLLYGSQLVLNCHREQCSAISVISLVLFLIVTLGLSRISKIGGNTGILMATGLAICGATAIAIVSPVLKAKKNEISIAVISLMIVGIIAIITFPLLREVLGIPPDGYALLVGSTIPMIGQVKVAAGPGLYQHALSAKLLRVGFLILLIPILIISKKDTGRNSFYVPWFVAGFILTAIAFNISTALRPLRELMEPLSIFSMSAALAAIGLDVDLEMMTIEGLKPLTVAVLSWVLVVLIILGYFIYV